MTNLRKVTKDEFFKAINADKLDVHPTIITDKYPYTSEWRFPRNPGRQVYGRTVGQPNGGNEYFLA